MRRAQQRLAELIAGAYAFDALDDFRQGLLTLLTDAVPSTIVSYNEVDDEPTHTWALSRPHLDDDLVATFARLAHENPVLEHIRRTRDGRPRRISDFLGRDELRKRALFREVYAQLGVESQVAFTLPSRAPVVIGIALSRGAADYTDAEVRLLALARPHLIQAYRAIELSSQRTALLGALEAGLDDVGNPVLAVDARGRIPFATAAARRILRDQLGVDVARGVLDLPRGPVRAAVLDGRDGPVTLRPIGAAGADGIRLVALERGSGGLERRGVA